MPPRLSRDLWHALPVAASAAIALLCVVGTAAWLQGASDGTYVPFGWGWWRADGVVVGVRGSSPLRHGDLVVAVAGHRLAAGPGGVPGRDQHPGATLRYDVVRGGVPMSVDVPLVRPRLAWLVPGPPAGNLLWLLLIGLLALYLHVRRPRSAATGPLVLCAGAGGGAIVVALAGLPVVDVATAGPWFWLNHAGMVGATSAAWGGMLALALVPLRPLWPGRHATVTGAAYAGPPAAAAGWTAAVAIAGPGGLAAVGLVHAGESAIGLASLLLAAAIVAIAYWRRRGEPAVRRWIRWIAGGGVVSGALLVAGWLGPEALRGGQLLPPQVVGLAGLPFAAGLAVAIVRHRLYGIRRLVSRSLVHAAVRVALAAGLLAGALAAGALAWPAGPLATGITTAAALLAASQVWRLVERPVGRALFGERADPAAARGRIDRLLTDEPDRLLPAVVETVAATLRVPYAAVELADGATERRGIPVGATYGESLRGHGRTLGRLVVSAREPDEPLAPADLALLGALAAQIGVALHAARLRRDLHDGIGPVLLGAALKVDAIRGMVESGDHPRTAPLLRDVTTSLRAAAGDLRGYVEGRRPRALEELGLTGAIRARAELLDGGPRIVVDGPGLDLRLPAAVEVAALHVAVEALTNAVRHAGASRCEVRVTCGRELRIEVTDDGRGLPDPVPAGMGLPSMRERAREVGGRCQVRSRPEGGTRVEAVLPLTLARR